MIHGGIYSQHISRLFITIDVSVHEKILVLIMVKTNGKQICRCSMWDDLSKGVLLKFLGKSGVNAFYLTGGLDQSTDLQTDHLKSEISGSPSWSYTLRTQRSRLAQGLAGDRRYWLDSIRLAPVKLRSNCSYSPACPCGSSVRQARCGRVDISLCSE